ncbi:MAG: ABC transporter substrate-binding protein, partial [Gammaproteobacteria bacterium]|nr:ABC transporter substrate-binding protein [Gammaproteobacteria bacterium]
QQYSKVRVFYQLWHDPLRTIGPNNWNESLINDCNGINVFHDASTTYPTVSLEDVLSKNPEVILIPYHSAKTWEKTQIWHKWKNIDAVKNKMIRVLDGDLINRFGPRAVEGLESLCVAINSAR